MPDTTHIAWRHSLEEAREEAQRTDRLVLIELFSPKCGGCQTMERVTFAHAAAIEFVNEGFVPVHVNVLEDEDALSRFDAGWTPTLIVQNARSREFRRSQGYLDPQKFVGEMSLARLQALLVEQKFGQAHALVPTVREATRGDAYREPEALYWAAVAHYKATGDQSFLVSGWNSLLNEFPASEWAGRASFIRMD